MKTTYLIIISLILLTACQNGSEQEEREITGGDPCIYESHIEQATISYFESLGDRHHCEHAVQLHFTLIESDTLPEGFSTETDYTYDIGISGIGTSEAYFESKGLTVGSNHDMNISQIITGTCSPLSFKFVDVNLSDRENYCME